MEQNTSRLILKMNKYLILAQIVSSNKSMKNKALGYRRKQPAFIWCERVLSR